MHTYPRLTYRETKQGAEMADDKILVRSYGNGKCEIHGLKPDEIHLVRDSIDIGHNWIRRGEEGRLEHALAHEPLPSPTEDPKMQPFWRRATAEEPVQMSLALLQDEDWSRNSSPSITIQHLCGYYYTPENYTEEAEKLESYGFECLRSRRGNDGRFWEIWFLPGVWCAKGDLLIAINDSQAENPKQKTEVAVKFLGRKVKFGTLDCSVQRMAMCIE